jgi:hypothetical protein
LRKREFSDLSWTGVAVLEYAHAMLFTRRCLATVLAVVSAFLLVAIASTALARTSTKHPKCTRVALTAALKRSARSAGIPKIRFQGPFGCVRNWAYSFDIVGTGRNRYEATALYHNNNGQWKLSNRRGPCLKHAVPKKIYQPACETN